jgi:hypothetical protein
MKLVQKAGIAKRREFEGAELAEMKDSAILFDELLMATKRGNTYWYRDH